MDLFDGTTFIGEYERSIPKEVERKRGEIERASEELRAVFYRYGTFVVRWNGTTRQKEIRCQGRVVGHVSSDYWRPPPERQRSDTPSHPPRTPTTLG